eukprot:TRINITY_DN6828_c0_g1_i1.p1 TRINITY_DN6828_c0_g1~~TRINITY_DN6828_c0_g1_i1.p1  ORF type:complete len:1109 (-),score=350.97 TRINITY_DN6828_c0_g1_i1:38-3364(-)
MSNQPSMEQILNAILSVDKNVREQAEKYFEQIKQTNPNALTTELLRVCQFAQEDHIKDMAAVLIRRIITQDESLWKVLDNNTRTIVKGQLIEAIKSITAMKTRRKLCDTVSEVAMVIFAEKQEPAKEWPELVQFLFDCAKSSSHKDVALTIFTQMALFLKEVVEQNSMSLKNFFVTSLQDKNPQIKLAALNAITCYIGSEVFSQEVVFELQKSLSDMINVIGALLKENHEDEARTCMGALIELATEFPSFYKTQINMIIQMFIQIATSKSLEDTTRQLALEFLVSIAENNPAMLRKAQNGVPSLIQLIVTFMLELQDDEEWINSKDETSLEITNYDVGSESLDRCSRSLTGKSVFPFLIKAVPQLLSNKSNWVHRYVGQQILCIMGDACEEQLKQVLSNALQMILGGCSDEHPRVRYAACNTLAQLCSDFQPVFQRDYPEQIVNAFISMMKDPIPKIAAHGASSVVNFCEGVKAKYVEKWVDPFMQVLLVMLQGGKLIVQEEVLSAIASLALTVKNSFIGYYDKLMPLLKNILKNATGKELRQLRGKAIECVTMMAVAVGKEKFMQDAKYIIEVLVEVQKGNMEPDDPQISFMLQAWARLCKILGDDFSSLLPVVMPPLFKSASQHVEAKIATNLETYEEMRQEGWEFVPLANQSLGVKTSILEEKATAVHMIQLYATNLKEVLIPYVKQSVEICLPLLHFYFSDEVRNNAATAMGPLMCSAVENAKKNPTEQNKLFVQTMWNLILPEMLECIVKEISIEVLSIKIDGLTAVFNEVDAKVLTEKQMQEISEIFIKIATKMFSRRDKRNLKKKSVDCDEEEAILIEDENKAEEDLLTSLTEWNGSIIKHHGVPWFQLIANQVSPMMKKMFEEDSLMTDKISGVCLFDDFLEYASPTSHPLFDMFFSQFFPLCASENDALRQACVYGIGILAQKAEQKFSPYVTQALNVLVQIINAPQSRDIKNVYPTENAIAAVGKFLLYRSKEIENEKVMSAYVSFLPVMEDKIESKVTYDQLCIFIEKQHPNIWGNNFSNANKIVEILVTIYDSDLIDKAISLRVQTILKNIGRIIPQQVAQNAFGALAQILQVKCQNILKEKFFDIFFSFLNYLIK